MLLKFKSLKHLKIQGCFLIFLVFSAQFTSAASATKSYVMGLQMTPLTCVGDVKNHSRACLEANAISMLGLKPEPLSSQCKTQSSAYLYPIQASLVARLLPDEQFRQQLWKSVGGCLQMTASEYFRKLMDYADHLHVPGMLSDPKNIQTSRQQMQLAFTKLNRNFPKDALVFQCTNWQKRIFLTQVQICYDAKGQYKKCASSLHSNCPEIFHVKGFS